MQFVLTRLGMPEARMAQAEYNPYDSPDEDDEEPKGLEPVMVAHAVNLKNVKDTVSRNTYKLQWAMIIVRKRSSDLTYNFQSLIPEYAPPTHPKSSHWKTLQNGERSTWSVTPRRENTPSLSPPTLKS